MKLDLIATSAFGLEAVVRRELEGLDMKVTGREDGRITFVTDERGLVKANLWLRTADRVLLKMGEFDAISFEDLFQGMKGLPWEQLIPLDGNFTVNGSSVKSKLSSMPACQSVAEKALVSRLDEVYGATRYAKTGARFDVHVNLLKDRVVVSVDTSGAGLHKRGYRQKQTEAPIKETLAAAMVQLSFWKPGRLLADPFCGSGTIPIEAALIGANIAPGLGRAFAAQEWDFIPKSIWKEEKSLAYKAIDYSKDIRILASDISRAALDAAKENAGNAGVLDFITFAEAPVSSLRAREKGGVIVCNPPYGERLGGQKEIDAIYRDLRSFMDMEPTWSLFLITSDDEFETHCMGRAADRRRKLYNGRIKTTYYQYHGAVPPR